MTQIRLRGHHLRNLHNYYVSNISLQEIEKLFITKYDKTLATRMIDTILSIKDNKTKIKFIDKPDYICEICPRYTKFCKGIESSEDDKRCLEVYNFKLNNIYPSQDILKRLKSISGVRMFYPEEFFPNKEEMITDYDVANKWLGIED